MKWSEGQLNGYLKNPDPHLRAVLIFGPDEGLVRERTDALAKSVVEDLSDPFNVVDMEGDALAADPARLMDEAAAISMMGGRRLIRLRGVSDKHTTHLKPYLEETPGDAMLLVLAGDLPAKGSMRKAFEAADIAAALACYADDTAGLDGLMSQILEAKGVILPSETRAFLAERLGGDRAMSRAELDKLALYVGAYGTDFADQPEEARTLSLDEAAACIGDSAALAFDAAGAAALSGNMTALVKALEKAFADGDNPVGILRLVARRLQRMHLVAGQMGEGVSTDQAIKALRPPAWGRERSELQNHLRLWPAGRLISAMGIVQEAEQQCKSTGLPAESLCARALMRIATAAQAAGRR